MYFRLEKDTVVHGFAVSVSLFCRADINLSRVKGVHDLVCSSVTDLWSHTSGVFAVWSVLKYRRTERIDIFLSSGENNKSQSRQQIYVASIEVSREANFVNGVLMRVLCYFLAAMQYLELSNSKKGKVQLKKEWFEVQLKAAKQVSNTQLPLKKRTIKYSNSCFYEESRAWFDVAAAVCEVAAIACACSSTLNQAAWFLDIIRFWFVIVLFFLFFLFPW